MIVHVSHRAGGYLMSPDRHPITIEVVTDPVEREAAMKRHAQADLNWKWLQDHILEIGEKHRGKSICIAGQELFVGDDPAEVVDRARAAHPEDKGVVFHYIYKERMARIYAHQRSMAT
jgi:hypothetical protein